MTATIRIDSRNVGSAEIGFLVTTVVSAFHSASSKYIEKGHREFPCPLGEVMDPPCYDQIYS